ncbi:hypothetical protein [Butyrivibrio sp. AE3004]|uniref:hypothetical protein n=1 Tax=Butyrivibrio sp. AE3004 TaxID=1506994 RepID=UPI00049461A3|nr:hypothetical protein [Butyrivibrio sp. AE3004]
MSAEENTEEINQKKVNVKKASQKDNSENVVDEELVNEAGEDSADEDPEEKPEEEKKEKKYRTETITITEAPKTRLITAIVMLMGSGFIAIYTMLQHYEIGAWIKTLFLSLVIFFIVGRLFELLVVHFDTLNSDKEKAIRIQEDAIAQRQADEQVARITEEEAAEAERLAAEEAERLAAEQAEENENLPDEYDSFGESDDFDLGPDLSKF